MFKNWQILEDQVSKFKDCKTIITYNNGKSIETKSGEEKQTDF